MADRRAGLFPGLEQAAYIALFPVDRSCDLTEIEYLWYFTWALHRPIATNKRHRLWDDRHRGQETCICPAFPSHLAGESKSV